MSDVVFWFLVAVVILAVQATEPPLAPAEAGGAPRRGGEPPPAAGTMPPGGGAADGPPQTGGTSGPPATGVTPGRPTTSVLGPGAATLARYVIAAAAVLMALLGLLTLAGGSGGGAGVDRNHEIIAGSLQLAAGLVCLGLFYYGTERVPGFRLMRPRAPISWLAIVLFFESLAIYLPPQAGQATVQNTVHPQQSTPTSAEDLMLGSLPFLIVAIAAVGPLVRRTLRQTAERLGLVPLRLPWWVVGIGVGMLLVPAGDWMAGLLSHLASSACVAQQTQVEQAIAGTARTTLEQVGVALAAGVCEETLFRGALQPRVGVLLSSALWAVYHLQYTCNGPSPFNLYILMLGFIFGALRKWGGLMPAILAHVVYDGVILLGLF